MIKALTSLDTIEIEIRKLIMSQLNLDGKFVLNALQFKGPIMHKNITTEGAQIFKSFSVNDTVVIFELYEDTDAEEMSEETMSDNSISEFVYANYTIKLIIYGNSSGIKAQTLKARLLTEENRDVLFDKGIHLTSISKIESASEFIETTMWLRRDFSINISCRFDVSKSSYNTMTNTDIKIVN